MRYERRVLAGDIGGTKTNLALYSVTDGGMTAIAKRQYSSREHETFEGAVADFLSETGISGADAACFGVSGPVIGGACRTTNLPWDLSEAGLAERFGFSEVRLLNDLEATAYGMLYLDEEAFVDLNPTARIVAGNRAVIAAGTGLGEAQLYRDGEIFHPIASEGGHCDFAPLTSRHDALLQWLRTRYPGHVSYERILSGPGVATLYDFLVHEGFASEPEAMISLEEGADRSAAVSHLALEDHDSLCQETLRLFAEIYGAEAGNLALKSMALGGIYIGGGIAPKILPALTDGAFLEGFLAKGRFEEMLRGVPVRVSLEPETALIGALRYAVDRLLP
jgi:glucokinase